jgi:hypothetical protein
LEPASSVSVYKRLGGLNSGIITTTLDGSVANFANVLSALERAYGVPAVQGALEHAGRDAIRLTLVQGDDTDFVAHPEVSADGGEKFLSVMVEHSDYDAEPEQSSIFLKLGRTRLAELRLPSRVYDGIAFPERASARKLEKLGELAVEGGYKLPFNATAASVGLSIRLFSQLKNLRYWSGAPEHILADVHDILPRSLTAGLGRTFGEVATVAMFAQTHMMNAILDEGFNVQGVVRHALNDWVTEMSKSTGEDYTDVGDRVGLRLSSGEAVSQLVAGPLASLRIGSFSLDDVLSFCENSIWSNQLLQEY